MNAPPPAMPTPATMAGIILRPREAIPAGVEAGVIRPDHFATCSQAEIAALPLLLGRHRLALGDLFSVEGEYADHVTITGGVAGLASLGGGMAGGSLIIEGSVGARVGARMQGGQIVVRGDAGLGAGLGMRGGSLRITGNAAPRAGGAWPGARSGMAGGRLVIDGDAGERLGEQMRRGVIVCHGHVAAEAAARMRGGTIVALGALDGRFGAGMRRGTIVARGMVSPWPAFRYDCRYEPVFVRLYLRSLGIDAPWAGASEGGEYYDRYHGDVMALGKGELLVLSHET